MIAEIVVGLIAVGTTLAGVYAFSRIKYWRDSYFGENDRYKEVLDKALAAEKNAAEKRSENEFLRMSVSGFMQKQVIATLTDQQAANLAQAVITYLSAVTKDPKDTN